LTHDWRRVHVAFFLADLVKGNGIIRHGGKESVASAGAVRLSGFRGCGNFSLIVSPEHRSMGSPPVAWWLDDYFSWLGHPYYLALFNRRLAPTVPIRKHCK